MTIIAVASIVIAGITTGFGTMGPALAEGRAVATALSSLAQQPDASATITRTLFVGPGDDRVHGDLLLRGLDDPHLRQSVLESRRSRRPRASRPMLIDWFTVGAQALNFVILVWLMRRFLYKPILDAIDAREKKIAAELADAAAKKAEAKKERDEFQHKNEEFDQQRAALLSKATDEAKAERQRLLDEARKAADALERQATGSAEKRGPQPQSGHRSPRPAGGVRHRAKGADGSRHDEPGRAHGRGVHPPPARDGRPGEGEPRPRPSRRRPSPRSCAARSSCPRSSARRSRTRSTRPSRRTSASGSRPRRIW